MNQQVPDDLISAYFDGEATPEERRRIENLLETSVEFRQMLDDTSKLSALLHSFPREAAPASLAPNVKKRTDAVIQTVSLPLTVARRSHLREWTAFSGGMIATIASVVLYVAFDSSHHDSRNEQLAHARMAGTPRLGITSSKAESDAKLAYDIGARGHDFDSESKAKTGSSNVDSVKLLMSETNVASASSPVVPAPVAAAPSLPVAGQAAALTSSFHFIPAPSNEDNPEIPLLPQQNDDFLRSLKKGDVILEYVANPNNMVMVVELTVVDIDRGAEMMEMVLERVLKKGESVEDLTAVESEASATKLSDSAQKPSGSAENLVVIYVRASGDQLADALSESSKIYRAFAPQMPLDLTLSEVAESSKLASETEAASGVPSTSAEAKDRTNDPNTIAVEANLVVNSFANQNGFAIDDASSEKWGLKERKEQMVRDFGPHSRISNKAASARVAVTEGLRRERDASDLDKTQQDLNKTDSAPDEQSEGFAAFRVAVNKTLPSVPQKQSQSRQSFPSQQWIQRNNQSKPQAGGKMAQKFNQSSVDSRESRLMRMLIVLKSEHAPEAP